MTFRPCKNFPTPSEKKRAASAASTLREVEKSRECTQALAELRKLFPKPIKQFRNFAKLELPNRAGSVPVRN